MIAFYLHLLDSSEMSHDFYLFEQRHKHQNLYICPHLLELSIFGRQTLQVSYVRHRIDKLGKMITDPYEHQLLHLLNPFDAQYRTRDHGILKTEQVARGCLVRQVHPRKLQNPRSCSVVHDFVQVSRQ